MINIIISNQIYIQINEEVNSIIDELKQKFTYSNKEYFKMKANSLTNTGVLGRS